MEVLSTHYVQTQRKIPEQQEIRLKGKFSTLIQFPELAKSPVEYYLKTTLVSTVEHPDIHAPFLFQKSLYLFANINMEPFVC